MKKIFPIILMIVCALAVCYFAWPKVINKELANNTEENIPSIEEKIPEIGSDTNIIFFGDSITAGYLTDGYAWPEYFSYNVDIGHVTNAGISDYRVSTYDDPNKWLVTEVESHYDDEYDYDYVIMQGGINDLFYDTPLGTMTDSFDESTFDANTFIGGLELYISKVKNKWPDAHIGYIITYYTPNYTERGITWTIEDYDKYYNATKEVLDKWEIKYLDLSDERYTEMLDVYNTTYLPDYLHLNTEGYDLISQYIHMFIQREL